MNFSWQYFFELFLKLPAYIPVTIFIAMASMLLAILVGALMTWFQLSNQKRYDTLLMFTFPYFVECRPWCNCF